MQTAEPKTTSVATKTKANQPFLLNKGEGSFFGKNERQTGAFFHSLSGNSLRRNNFIQPKLTIGQPDDPYEKEADAMADKVVQRLAAPESVTKVDPAVQAKPLASTITPVVQKKCAHCEEEEKLQKKETDKELPEETLQQKSFDGGETPPDDVKNIQRKCAACEQEERLQRKSGSASSATPFMEKNLMASKGSGSPLPSSTRQQMESSFGADFSKVRIHTDHNAVQMNKDLHAQAFTHGNDIYFNSAKYNPDTSSGKHLLAHELTHTLQQNGGPLTARKKIQRLPDWVSDAAGWVSDTATDVAGDVVEGAEWVGGQVADGARWVGGKAASGAEWVGDQVSKAAEWVFDQIRSVINSGINFLNEKWESIKDFGRSSFEDIKNGFAGLVHFVTMPLSGFMSALSIMNADLLGGMWNLAKTGANALWLGINSVINNILQVGKGIWDTVSGFINSIFEKVSELFNYTAFDLLPDWVKKEARSIFNTLQSLWNKVSSFWADLWQRLTNTIQEILAAVRSFINNIINFGIDAVIFMVRNLREVYDYVTKVFADPRATIQPFLDQIAIRLDSEVPGNANNIGSQLARENYPNGQTDTNGAIQRQPIDSEDRTTATLEEVGKGIVYYIAQAWADLNIKDMLWQTVVNMFWPPATIKAIVNQFYLLWTDDWATTVASLYTPRNFFDDPIGCLHDIWSNLLILLDFPLALWRTLNNVVGLLMGYITIIVVLIEAIGGAIAGAAAGGVGAIPGFLAGAAAGLETVAAIGEALMASYLAAESGTVIVILTRLYTARQVCEKRQVDILTSVASFITMAVALALQVLMALLAELVSLIAGILKGTPQTVPVPQPTPEPVPAPTPAPRPAPQPVPAQPVPAQPVPAQPAVPDGGKVIPFPRRPAPTPETPAAPGRIAAKFEEGVSRDPFPESLHADNLLSGGINGLDTDQKSSPDPDEMALSGLELSVSGILQTSRVDQINPDACDEEDDCKNIVVPGYAPQDNISRDHARRHGGVSQSLAQEVTNIRQNTGFKKLSDYYGNNIAGFIYAVFETDTSTIPIDTGTIVRKNDDVHSEERIVAELLEIRRNYPMSNVIRVDQIATERSACSTCYDLIRNSRILTANKIYTQSSAIYFVVRYTANRNINAKALRERYCGLTKAGK